MAKQSKWQKEFSLGFTGKKMGLTKREKQNKKVEEMKAQAKKDKAARDKRGY